MRFLFLSLIFIISCGQESGTKSVPQASVPNPSRPPVTVDPDVIHRDPRVNPDDVKKIADLLPTMYYIAEEAKANCKGKYGSVTYNGTEKSEVRTMDGTVIEKVCTRFHKILSMEGSAVLKNNISVNYSGIVDGEKTLSRSRALYLRRGC